LSQKGKAASVLTAQRPRRRLKMKVAAWLSMLGGARAVVQPWVNIDKCEVRSDVALVECALRELYPKRNAAALDPATMADVILALPGWQDKDSTAAQSKRGLAEGDLFVGLGAGGAQAAMQVFLTSEASAASVEQDLKQHQLSTVAVGALADNGVDTQATSKRLTTGNTEVKLRVGSPNQGQELKATLGVWDDVDLSEASVVLAPAGEELEAMLPRLSPGTILILREKVGGCSPGLVQLSQAKNDKGVVTAFAYMVTPAEEVDLINHLSSAESVQAELKRSSAGRRLSRLRAGVMAVRDRTYADHRRIGSTGSEVHCDALKLFDAVEKDQQAVDKVLAEIDVNRKDNKMYDVLRYVIEEQTLLRKEKAPPARMTALMNLLQNVVKARTAMPQKAQKAEL